MNKMLRREVVEHPSKNKHSVSFFEDDSVATVREQLAKSAGSHPDRMFVLVGLRLPPDYYAQDPRRWEALFERLSYNGSVIEKDVFQEYQLTYRSPATAAPYHPYDRAEWMARPDELRAIFEPTAEFVEYRILGTDEPQSYVLPLDVDAHLVSRIPSARLPIPQNTKLMSSLYPGAQIERFLCRVYDDTAETVAFAYYPFFRTTTPDRMSEESVRLLNKNAALIQGLLGLDAPEPEAITIVRTRFYVPWVDTDFGPAIRTKFEQLFYGLTISQDIPYIGLFTSKDQVTRHKFFAKDPVHKSPEPEIRSHWNTWWSLTRPVRNIPTLILYRGEGKHNFDRVAITAKDMVVSTYRPEGNTETLDSIRKAVAKWITKFDSVMPFVSEGDLAPERWELQDLSFLAKYADRMEDFDLLRFGCVSSVFDISDKTKSQFSILRSDHENDGLTSVEVKLLQMVKEGNILRAQDVAEELSISVGSAGLLIRKIEDRLEEDPKLGDRAFRGFPTIRVGPDFVIASGVNSLERPVKYANILRYILSNPESDGLDALCPKRVERVDANTSVVPAENVEADAALVEEYSDLFGYLEQEGSVKEESASVAETAEESRISTDQGQRTTYNYFKNRLQQFDPDTFDFPGSQYPKKCEQKHQPVILSQTDLARVKDTPYDPKSYMSEDQIVSLENPDGSMVCPEFWCMRDQIPLQESQLDHSTGVARCPVCKGKLQTRASDNAREFPLVKRETGFAFPGFIGYKSTKNGKNLPCCFRKSRASKNDRMEEAVEDKYYILSETKTDISPFRNAFLPPSLIAALHIQESYELMEGKSRRLATGMSGFFRVGMGRPAETLAGFLGLKVRVPSPRESVDTVLKCSFLRTWATPSDTHAAQIDGLLANTSPFENDPVVRHALARLISGVDEAFHAKALTNIQELEYCALALQCDVFRILADSNTLGCMFYTPMVRVRTRGIIVIQSEDDVDILAHVSRLTRGFEYKCNVFESPFKQETYVELERLRNTSCATEVPGYETALKVMQQIAEDDFSVVLDPYGRAQAFYVPDKLILPFQSTPLPSVAQPKLSGYSEVSRPPARAEVVRYLEVAAKTSKGYAWKEDMFNSKRELVEVLTESGLRIPVRPESLQDHAREALEVMDTLKSVGETGLAFGPPSEAVKKTYADISYSSEVYDFLIFQLTRDLESDYRELRAALQAVRPSHAETEPLLRAWFDETVLFADIDAPTQFLSKVRAPCGQFKTKKECGGNMCGWDGKVCRIQVGKSVEKTKLFGRMLSALVENSKIRSIVLDGRTSPFFSTILYMELPNELIVTDSELDDILAV